MGKHVFNEEENSFREWLRSISFVRPDGTLLPLELNEDTSPDPDGDREEEE